MKKEYISPAIDVIAVESEGMICTSPGESASPTYSGWSIDDVVSTNSFSIEDSSNPLEDEEIN